MGIFKRDPQQGSQQIQPIFDNGPQIKYNGAWVQNQFLDPTTDPPSNETSHSTAQRGSSMFLSFYGSQINASGTVPAGDGDLSANYTIDDGPPVTQAVNTISQSSDLLHQTLFESPILELGPHNLTVQVIETGFGRNYTFQQFNVSTTEGAQIASDNGSSTEKQASSSSPGNSNAAAIVGGVLGSIIILLGILYLWERSRSARSSRTEHTVPRVYYARPISDRSIKVPYIFDQPSVMDTDSKFTFTARKELSDVSRRSWVTFDRPPTVPWSALLSERNIADWSTYKGSSVIYQPPPNAERSRFSSYTSEALSSLNFREPTSHPSLHSAAHSSSLRGLRLSDSSLSAQYGNRKL